MATYQELTDYFQSSVPSGNVDPFTPGWENRFNSWIGGIMQDLGVTSWDQVPVAELGNYEYIGEGSPAGGGQPIEQGLFDQLWPGLQDDIDNDATRRELAATLTGQAGEDYDIARGILDRSLPAFDPSTYLAENTDVRGAFDQLSKDEMGRALVPTENGVVPMTLDEWARYHYDVAGRGEGREGGESVNSPRYYDEIAQAGVTESELIDSARVSAEEQLESLRQTVATMKGSLNGQLAEQAAALEEQIATLHDNLTTLDASQRQALADQIAATQSNLETAIESQRQNLATEIESLEGNANAEAASRRAALQTEIDALNAAQEPMNAARLSAAQGLTTAINLGLESTRDALTAQNARRGYIGGSTQENAALARAVIGARQDAANVMGGARVQNAADVRDIARRDATGARTISDELAAAIRGIGDYGASGRRTLDDALATGTQTIADFGANETRGIDDRTSMGRFNIDNYGADTTYQNRLWGAEENRRLEDYESGTGFNIATALAQQSQGARDAGTRARQNYFDNDYVRQLQAALTRGELGRGYLNDLQSYDDYGNSGARRTLDTLNWWSTGGTPYTSPYAPNQPSNVGSDIAGLGANLVGSAFNLGNSQNWWQPQKTPGNNGATTFDDFIQDNPSSGAAGWLNPGGG